MMAFDGRAMENIASAPATRDDRVGALWVAGAFALTFLVVVAARLVRLPEVPGFVPAIAAAETVALIVTAVLLYLQYRVARQAQLALLAFAYFWAAATGTIQLVFFPHAFGPVGILGSSPQTAAYLYLFQHVGFALFVIAFAALDRSGRHLTTRTVRRVAGLTLLALVVACFVAIRAHGVLPDALDGNVFTPGWVHVAVPLMTGVLLLAIGAQIASGTRTVTQVWLLVVSLGWTLSVVGSTMLIPERYSLPWYGARLDGLAADALVLAVFLVKFQGLLGRLATTSVESEARYRTLINLVPQLIWVTDAGGRTVDVNDRWRAYLGAGVMDWKTIVHPEQSAGAQERWTHALRTGEAYVDELRLRDGGGRFRWFLVNVVPQRDGDPRVLRWIGTATDIDVNKRLEERDAFVARAGERLGASLDTAAVLSAMKALVVPRLATWCEVDLLDDDGRYVLAAVGRVDVGAEIAARSELGRVAAAADAERLRRIAEAVGPVADAADPGAVRVALRDRDDPIGVLTVRRDRPYEPDDVVLLVELARRASVSLRHARVYERERSTADALQRAMLPQALPIREAVRFSASYSAASESQRVGGDFYDAFDLPDGRIALTIGDVTGHGLQAAVIMGEIRQAIRASSFERAEPSAILDRASRLLVASGRSVFVTAVFGVLDPLTGAFVYATAGHPPPLLLDGSRLVHLPGSGLPLGLRDDDGVDFGLTLPPDGTLVLYTDGLLEFNRDLADAERRIDASVVALVEDRTEHLAAAIMKEVLGDDEPSDDIAILTATLSGDVPVPVTDVRTWRLPADDARAGALVRLEAGELVAERDGEEARFVAELAVGELLANVVRHAPGRAEVRLERGPGGTTLVVVDGGGGFTRERGALDPLAESGRGLALLEALAPAVEIVPLAGGGTRVAVHLRVPARGTNGAGEVCAGGARGQQVRGEEGARAEV